MGENVSNCRLVWMDQNKKIVSFHEVMGFQCVDLETESFWTQIINWVKIGYRIQ